MSDDRRNGQDDLERRIADAKARNTHKVHGPQEGVSENRGWAVGIEFVGSVLVGAVVGLLLDKWLGTAPWIMIVLLLLGFVAGLRRAITMSKQFDTDFTNDKQ
ncbi:F0F1 ATP synthase assembly protein [Stakelama sediminis]|uniref:ATP synthase protein I n=1 Tax=Stakelama sediminis TaxID=463200 RepID=A0A840YVN7_9SPHN|nr:AtpZ/AtpI family protein [Stakelama sediminis]MBB5717609.1 ATP synthase protein I [Stakelama sediminis]